MGEGDEHGAWSGALCVCVVGRRVAKLPVDSIDDDGTSTLGGHFEPAPHIAILTRRRGRVVHLCIPSRVVVYILHNKGNTIIIRCKLVD